MNKKQIQINGHTLIIEPNGEIYRILKSGLRKRMMKQNTLTSQYIMLKGSKYHVKNIIYNTFNNSNIDADNIYNIDCNPYNNSIENLAVMDDPYGYLMREIIVDNKRYKNINNRYYICDDGKVYVYNNGFIEHKINQNIRGYIELSTYINGERKQKLVHRIVAEAFIPNEDPDKKHIDHINEIKTDNSVDNLRWCSPKENVHYYNTKNGRDYRLKLRREYVNKAKKIQIETKALLRKKEIELRKAENKILKLQKQLDKDRKKFSEYIKREKQAIDIRNKYIDSKIDMPSTVIGYKCKVNGIEFNTAGSAAKYIIEQELKDNRTRNKATISKEIRRILSGKRKGSLMYKKYRIESV